MGRAAFFWAVSIAVVAAAAAGAASAQEKALAPLRIGTLKIASQADVGAAIRQGIFKKHGLDVKISFFNTGAESIPAMQGGAVDVVLAIPGIGMAAIDRGIEITCVFQDEVAHAGPPDSASVQVLEASPIRSLAELRGKSLAERVKAMTAIAHPKFREALERGGHAITRSRPHGQIRPQPIMSSVA